MVNASYVSTGLNVTSSSANSATNFVFSIAPGCMGTLPSTTAANTGLTFTPTGTIGTVGTTLFIPVTITITTGGGSALVPTPSSLTFTCNKTAGTVTGAQQVNVTSAATGGTPFTVGTIAGSSSSISVSAGGLATGTAVGLTVTVAAGTTTNCGALPSGTNTFTVPLLSGPATSQVTKNFSVSIIVGTTSPLIPSPTSVALTYTQGSNSSSWAAATTSLTSNPTPLYVQVQQTTVPSWLAVTETSGGPDTPVTLSFLPGSGVTGLNVGNYTAQVHLKVTGYLDYVLPVTIQVNAPAPTLSILQGATPGLTCTNATTCTETLYWVVGNATAPTFTLTPISSDTPIAFTVAPSGNLAPISSTTQGLAYNFGSPFTVSFPASTIGALAPSPTAVTGQVVISGGSTTITVGIKLYVEPPTALISSLTPSVLPTSPSGVNPFVVVISGSGFVVPQGGLGGTVAGIVPSAGVLVVDPNIAVTVQDTSTIVLSITVPATPDPYLPFSSAATTTVTVGVCNPNAGGTVCSAPGGGGTASLTIGINPIVSAVTSASSYIEATAPTLPTIAPYDILTIFGTNFCVSGGTGCVVGSSNALLFAATNPTTFAYPLSLSPDASGATQRNLAVNFYAHGNTTTPLATAPLLFATNNQINLMAPSALLAKVGSTVDIIVSFGYGNGANMLKSQAYTVNVAATDPGVFTIGGDGQGNAAALNNTTWALITQSAPANMRTTAANSDYVDLYVTGLGVPDSTSTGTAVGSGASQFCMAPAAYWANDTGTTSDDGLVIEPAFYTANTIQPCFLLAGSNVPTVTVGGQPATVLFAGWVQGAVAGLYQIDIQLPSSTPTLPNSTPAFTYAANNTPGNVMGTNIVSLPVVVTTPANSKTSQVGASLWAQQSLLATASCATSGTPAACGAATLAGPSVVTSNPVYTLTATHGVALPATTAAITIIGSQGAASGASYSFAAGASTGSVNGLALSAFPDDLAVDPATGILSGTPGTDANGLNIEVTVTDATSGFTGNAIITLNIT